MTRIQVYGPGCAKCRVLVERTEQAIRELGLPAELEKVTDLNAIVEAGVLATPALAVDGAIRVTGRVPTVAQIKEMLT